MQQESLKIFGIISQIEQALEASPKPRMGGGNKRTVDIDDIFDLLGDLKVTIPEDIRRANSILIEQESMLTHAGEEADEVIAQAQLEAQNMRQQAQQEMEETRAKAQEELMASREQAEREFESRVADHAVLTEAKRRAELLQQHAEHNANVVYYGAKQYADEILQDVQRYLTQYGAMIDQNRAELGVKEPPAPQPMPPLQQPVQPVPQAAPQPVQQPIPQPAAPQRQAAVSPQYQQPQAAVSPQYQQAPPPRQPVEDTQVVPRQLTQPPQPAPSYGEDEIYEEERPRKRWRPFARKNQADDFDEPEDAFEEDTLPRKRRGRREQDELDLDLGE